MTRKLVCQRCNGLGIVGVPCDDPQCGDSTWDHDCNLGSAPCPDCAAKGLPPSVEVEALAAPAQPKEPRK